LAAEWAVAGADGAPIGWRGLCRLGDARTLACAAAQRVWQVDERCPPSACRTLLHALSGGRPTRERITALCRAGDGSDGSAAPLFACATGARLLLFDARHAAHPLLIWRHELGEDDADPPRLLACAPAARWLRGAAPAERSWLLSACTLRARASLAVQFTVADAAEAAQLAAKDAQGWASGLLRARVGARALGAPQRLPCPAAARDPLPLPPPALPHRADSLAAPPAAQQQQQQRALSHPDSAGFLSRPPPAVGAAGMLLAMAGDGPLCVSRCAHVAVGTPGSGRACPALPQPRSLGETDPPAPPAPRAKRPPCRALPLLDAYLGGGEEGDTTGLPGQVPPRVPGWPAVAPAGYVAAAHRAPWALTLLEATHAALVGRLSAGAAGPALLRESALVSAAVRQPRGVAGARQRARMGPSALARRAALLPMLTRPQEGHPAGGAVAEHAPLGDGTPALWVARAALRRATEEADAWGAPQLSSLLLPAAAQGGTADSHDPAALRQQASPPSAAAGAHCASLLACWASCEGWRPGGGADAAPPWAQLFFASQHAGDAQPLLAPLQSLPPPRDPQAMQELQRRWEGARAQAQTVAGGALVAVTPETQTQGGGQEGPSQPPAKKAKKKSRKDGF